MSKFGVLVALITISAIGQPSQYKNTYSVLDYYYDGILNTPDSNIIMSNKINYPGLFKTDNSSITFGLLPKNACLPNFSPRNKLERMFISAEKNGEKNNVGIHVSLLDIDSYSGTESNKYLNRTYIGGKASIWYTPISASTFKGISISIFDRYSYTLSKDVSEILDIASDTSYTASMKSDLFKTNLLEISTQSLFKIKKDEYFSIGINGSNNFDKRFNTLRWHYINQDSTFENNHNYVNEINKIGIILGIIKFKKQIIEFSANIWKNNLPPYSSSTTGNEFGVSYNNNKRIRIKNNNIWIGFKTDIGVTNLYYSSSASWIPLDYTNRTLSCRILIPLLANIHIYKSLYGIFKIEPKLISSLQFDKLNSSRNHELYLDCNEIGFGLKGKIDDKLEYVFMPSFASEIFEAGLEVHYNF